MGKKKRRWPWVLAGVLLLSVTVWYIRVQYYGLMNCGTSAEDMTQYVEQMVKGKDIYDLKIAVRKTARGGRTQAILYEEYRDSDPDWKYGYVIFFERQLFGLRLDKRQFLRDFGTTVERGLPAEMAFMRACGAFATDNADELTLTPKGRYLVVVMMRQFFIGVNNLRDQARAALTGEELIFGDGCK